MQPAPSTPAVAPKDATPGAEAAPPPPIDPDAASRGRPSAAGREEANGSETEAAPGPTDRSKESPARLGSEPKQGDARGSTTLPAAGLGPDLTPPTDLRTAAQVALVVVIFVAAVWGLYAWLIAASGRRQSREIASRGDWAATDRKAAAQRNQSDLEIARRQVYDLRRDNDWLRKENERLDSRLRALEAVPREAGHAAPAHDGNRPANPEQPPTPAGTRANSSAPYREMDRVRAQQNSGGLATSMQAPAIIPEPVVLRVDRMALARTALLDVWQTNWEANLDVDAFHRAARDIAGVDNVTDEGKMVVVRIRVDGNDERLYLPMRYETHESRDYYDFTDEHRDARIRRIEIPCVERAGQRTRGRACATQSQ